METQLKPSKCLRNLALSAWPHEIIETPARYSDFQLDSKPDQIDTEIIYNHPLSIDLDPRGGVKQWRDPML